MSKLIQYPVALIELTRPINMIITALTVWVGGILAGGRGFLLSETLILAAISAGLIAAGGNAVNDFFDEDIDRINRPNRPIPSGRVSYIVALIWGTLLMLSGIVLGFSLDLTLGIIALIVTLLLWLYSFWLKYTTLMGNFAVAFCGGLAFIYGAVAVDNPIQGMYPALFAFLIHIAREIIKDIQDISGDRIQGAMTLPIATGRRTAQRTAAGVLMLLIIATQVPYHLQSWYSLNYLILISVLVDLPLLILISILWHRLNLKQIGRVSLALKLIMIGGLVALYVG